MSRSETVQEAPCMSQSVDVTCLLGSKRKRNSADPSPASKIILKPVLKGSLRRHNNKVTWSGCWGLTKEHYSSGFTESVVKAPFYFERKSLASENLEENCLLPQDGYFSGYFCMQDLSRPTLNCSYKKFYEKEVLLRFTKKETGHSFDVVGSGQNKFGKYLIEGTYDSISNEIHCSRNYLPNLKRPPSPARRRSSKPTTPTSGKRSSRIRTPSAKYMEAFGLGEHKEKIMSPANDFEGKDIILKLLSNFSDKSGSAEASKLLDDLNKRKIRSLKSAFRQLYEISLVVKDAAGMSELKEGLKSLQQKYKLKVSKKRSLKNEATPAVNADNYVSLFEDVKDLQELDPIGLNLRCRLPDKMKSPTLTGMVDLKTTFENCELTDASYGEGSEHLSEIEDLYPINNVDFSDLSRLDAETLKELNEFVEFVCPSKGS